MAVREDYFPELAAMFRDSERGPRAGYCEYVQTAGAMAERLDVSGFTTAGANETLRLSESGREDEWVEPFEVWLRGLETAVRLDTAHDELPSWLNAIDPRFILRLCLLYVEPNVEVALDLSDLVSRGYLEESGSFCSDSFNDVVVKRGEQSPLIVLTEGSTDAEVLNFGIQVLRPHLQGFLRFPDFTLKQEANSSALVKTVKNFAAAGVANRIVALFDNDTAGAEGMKQFAALPLSSNFKAITLPVSDVARKYPTVGPTGHAELDVNGLACSIEMYFGKDLLIDCDGRLRPVQWMGYSSGMQRYQGEVIGKRELQRKFRERAKRSIAAVKPEGDWSGIEEVLTAILEAHAPATGKMF